MARRVVTDISRYRPSVNRGLYNSFDGTGIGMTPGGVRNAGDRASYSDPVWIASFRHWSEEQQRAHVLRYFPTWSAEEREEFNRRNGTGWQLLW